LSVLEFSSLSFIPKRIFYVRGVPNNGIRGKHAHIQCFQIYICINGEINVHIINSLGEEHYCNLKKDDCLLIPPFLWTEEQFIGEESVLLVLCSHEYNKDDYIYSVDELKAVNGKTK